MKYHPSTQDAFASSASTSKRRATLQILGVGAAAGLITVLMMRDGKASAHSDNGQTSVNHPGWSHNSGNDANGYTPSSDGYPKSWAIVERNYSANSGTRPFSKEERYQNAQASAMQTAEGLRQLFDTITHITMPGTRHEFSGSGKIYQRINEVWKGKTDPSGYYLVFETGSPPAVMVIDCEAKNGEPRNPDNTRMYMQYLPDGWETQDPEIYELVSLLNHAYWPMHGEGTVVASLSYEQTQLFENGSEVWAPVPFTSWSFKVDGDVFEDDSFAIPGSLLEEGETYGTYMPGSPLEYGR